MRASDTLSARFALSPAQERVLGCEGMAVVTGPPGSGKTTALAAYAAKNLASGKTPCVVISHESGRLAFRRALDELGCDPNAPNIGTLGEHAARWMRDAYLDADAAPFVDVGGPQATQAIVLMAARGLLDMTWPMFARSDVDLDLPYLSKPDTFLEEASSLFRLLQRSRVNPQEFEEGCARGLGAFYGEQTERAWALLADRSLQQGTSKRAREAMRADARVLSRQRKAERDVGAILVQLYREYLEAARASAWRSTDDLLDACVSWLERDAIARERLAGSIGALLVDDAEDGEPSLGAIIGLLRSARALPVVLAGWDAARIDGLHGRRSALRGLEQAERISLQALAIAPPSAARRFQDEDQEIGWLRGAIAELIEEGVAPDRIAVLTRDADAGAHYARRLQSLGIPALMPSTRLERPVEMADLFALAIVVEDPLDQAHLMRVLSSGLVGLSDASLRAMCREPGERQQLRLEIGEELNASGAGTRPPPETLARNMFDGSVDASLSDAARAAVRSLRADLERWRRICATMSRTEQFAYLAQSAGFVARWQGADAHERERLSSDLERTIGAIATAESAMPELSFADIEELLEDEVVRVAPAKPTVGAVAVETIVGCKGLRFDHVFVSGVAFERFPRIYTSHAMAFSRTYGLIIRENVASRASQTAKFAWYYARFGAKTMYLDEERRALAYGLSRGRSSATATGFGVPPPWARDQDLLTGWESVPAESAAP
ncbi:MAG TPA: 3'-5' exonuclease [Candidatus Acidoferrales bacterium]|nr:3'-5' exonuclease [Candidatus Acidoferrales bacterium]